MFSRSSYTFKKLLHFNHFTTTMHFLKALLPSFLLAGVVHAAGWGIDEATISVISKGSSDGGLKEKYAQPLESEPIGLNSRLTALQTLRQSSSLERRYVRSNRLAQDCPNSK